MHNRARFKNDKKRHGPSWRKPKKAKQSQQGNANGNGGHVNKYADKRGQ